MLVLKSQTIGFWHNCKFHDRKGRLSTISQVQQARDGSLGEGGLISCHRISELDISDSLSLCVCVWISPPGRIAF